MRELDPPPTGHALHVLCAVTSTRRFGLVPAQLRGAGHVRGAGRPSPPASLGLRGPGWTLGPRWTLTSTASPAHVPGGTPRLSGVSLEELGADSEPLVSGLPFAESESRVNSGRPFPAEPAPQRVGRQAARRNDEDARVGRVGGGWEGGRRPGTFSGRHRGAGSSGRKGIWGETAARRHGAGLRGGRLAPGGRRCVWRRLRCRTVGWGTLVELVGGRWLAPRTAPP